MKVCDTLIQANSRVFSRRRRSFPCMKTNLGSEFMESTVPTSTLTVEDNWLNESLYELHRPKGVPTVQVLLFHGFQPDYEKPHLSTWMSRDGSHLWPKTWLAEEFPDAHILSVSYFGGQLHGLKKFGKGVDVDMHIVIENLISDLLQAGIGQKRWCPVVLIGHSFGGLVVKQLCVRAFNQLGPDSRAVKDLKTNQLVSFVDNIKGIFFYATPHHGVQSKSIRCLDPALLIPEGPLLVYVESLSKVTARLNDEFDNRWKQHTEWRILGLGESLPTRFETKLRSFKDLIVPEGSARYSVFNLAEGVDHFSISRPDSKICRSFTGVKGLLEDIANDAQLVSLDGHQETGLPEFLTALENHVLAIKQRLTKAGVLAITGMGGIGKTTLAKKVYNDISKDFEYTCFAENVKVQLVNSFDDWLFSKFYRNGRRTEIRQWSELKRRKTLIIMDDIDSEDQLRRLPALQEFVEGSHIILTSRDAETSKFYSNCGLYDMDFLKEDDAKQLFCLHAFGVKDVPVESNHLEKNVKAVVRKCDKLPLTLEVMGRYLRGESNNEVWKDAVDQLTAAQSVGGGRNDRVWASLRVSFDALEEQQKIMFTEAGTYFFGQSLDQALGAWSMTFTNMNPKIMWKNLVRRSLVKEGQDKTVWVHEQLRDLSRNIANNDVVVRSDENADTVKQERVPDKVSAKIESLKVSYRRRALQLDSLAELKELKYVNFDTVEHKGSGSNFPRRVSLLNWKTRPESKSQFPVDLTKMNNLAVLKLENWYVSKPFTNTLGHLTNLRYLSLSGLKGLDHLPENLGDLSHLKWLIVKGLEGESLTGTSVELFGKLSALEHLQLENVKVAELPESFGNLAALEHLEFVNVELAKLPDSFGNLSSLKSLHIEGCPAERLPDSFSRLSRLQRLSLRKLGLTDLGDAFGRISSIEDLWLSDLPISRLPDSFSQLSRLEKLRIENCQSLKDLGDPFGSLPALVSFIVSNTGVDRLPESIGGLISLKVLKTGGNDRVDRLPESLGNLHRLETLVITEPRLKCLPSSVGKLSSLRRLAIDCEALEELPDCLQMLSALKKLEICCDKFMGLPYGFGKLTSLESLDILNSNLGTLPHSIGQLRSLTGLWIWGHKLESLPDSLGRLSSLQSLYVRGAKLESLPDSLGRLSLLQWLNIGGDKLESLPDSLGRLSSLRSLSIEGDKLESLPDSLGRLSSLQRLEIRGHKLESLPDSLGRLSSLQRLDIEGDKLESLPDSIGQLCSLRTLSLCKVRSIRRLPDSLGQLSSLRELHLQVCDNLKSLPHSLRRLSSSELAPRRGERRNAEELSLRTTFEEANKGELIIFIGIDSEPYRYGCRYLDESTMRSLGWEVDGVDCVHGYEQVRYRMKWPHNRNVPGLRILAVMVNVVVCYFLVRKVHSSLRSK